MEAWWQFWCNYGIALKKWQILGYTGLYRPVAAMEV